MHARLGGKRLRRSDPIRRNVQRGVRCGQRISARITPHHLAARVFDFEGRRARRCRAHVVIDHRALGRVFTSGLVGRQWRITVQVPANAERRLRTEQDGRPIDQ